MMRMPFVLAGLLASSFVMPAVAGSAYWKCVETADPPGCIARRAVGSFGLESSEVLEAVLRHGLVDLVPAKSGRLINGLYGSIGAPDAKMDSPEDQLLDSSASDALRKSPRKSLLAAMALVAAARHDSTPFDNPIYLELAHKAKDDPRIPALALGMWIEIVGMSGSPPDFRVTHVGLPALWERAVSRKEQDAILIEDIAGTLAFLDKLMPQTEEFYLWYAHRPGLTPYQRVTAASRLARHFDRYEEAAALLAGVGDDVEGYDVPGVRNEVAAARLGKGYDAAAARLVVAEILDDLATNGVRFVQLDNIFNTNRDALERCGARNELRELGAEYLRHAEALDGKPEVADWYAAASDLYMRAGDRERAREVARLGVPYVPTLVQGTANAVQGRGTSAVIALYRAGAVEEALKTGYLSGKDRYINAGRAGEKQDPRWAIDGGWLFIGSMASDAARSTDREFQQRAYDGLVRSCGKPLADCFDETLRNIAQVAAGMGDEARMKEALGAAARQLDKSSVTGFSALYIAGPWAHCQELLSAAKRQ